MWINDVSTPLNGFMSLLTEALTRGGAYRSACVGLVVQRALHSAYTKRVWSTPLQVMMGWAPPTAIMLILAFAGQTGWNIERFGYQTAR